jgi:hypothetical protein
MAGESLPSFDAEARCPKCGHDGVNAVWREKAPWRSYGDPSPREEHLSRRCLRCSFTWYEAPLSSPPPPLVSDFQPEEG